MVFEALGKCHSVQAVKGEFDVSLKGVGDKDTIVKRVLEMVNCSCLWCGIILSTSHC